MTLTIDLPEEEITRLQAKASAEGLSAEQCARQLLTEALASPQTRPPLSARIRAIWADMPDEVRAKLPADGASQHDHSIYGVPRENHKGTFYWVALTNPVDRHSREALGLTIFSEPVQ